MLIVVFNGNRSRQAGAPMLSSATRRKPCGSCSSCELGDSCQQLLASGLSLLKPSECALPLYSLLPEALNLELANCAVAGSAKATLGSLALTAAFVCMTLPQGPGAHDGLFEQLPSSGELMKSSSAAIFG